MKFKDGVIFFKNNNEAIKAQELLFSLGLKWASGGNKVIKNENIGSISIFTRDIPLILRIIIPILWFKPNGLCMQRLDRSWLPYYYDLNDESKPKISGHTNQPFEIVFNSFEEFEQYVNENSQA